MDGENKGKPYEQMDDLGEFFPLFSQTHTYIYIYTYIYTSILSYIGILP